jgi:hypothetical protein
MSNIKSKLAHVRVKRFAQRLAQYPDLQDRFEALLDLVENSRGDAIKAGRRCS